jgi:hypothetical protein
MTRVDGDNQGPNEAERAAKEADKRARDTKLAQADRQAFGRLLEQHKGAKDQAHRAGAQQANRKTDDGAKKAGEQATAALAARQGVVQHGRLAEASKTFQGSLERAHANAHAADHGRVERREAGKHKDRVEHEDRREVHEARAEAKRDREADVARAEASEAQRPNAAISGGSDGSDAGGQSRRDDGSAAAATAIQQTAATTSAQSAQEARPVKQIPPELLEKLVSTVYLAVTEKGLKEFQIELKDGPLQGGFLKISADGGKVSLAFSGLGANERALLESSKGELMRRLGKKGLTLGRLDVK